MSSPRSNSSHSTFDTFKETFVDGFKSTGRSLYQAFTPSNLQAAGRQAGELAHVITHPRESASTLSDISSIGRRQAGNGEIDKYHTTAAIGGDMLGATVALGAMTMLSSALLKRPYLATQFGRNMLGRADTFSQQMATRFNMPGLHRQRMVEFVATRPLSFGLGMTLGTGVALGGASERERTAHDNAVEHPEMHAKLQQTKLHNIAATPLSRVRKTSTTPGK